ncbi:fdxN element excision recombinase XisF [Geminocystis sp. NIES-3709]|uniref:fdxN element excision recombinase XisF n=1 Tax=Geminocystis sp. NIES-3709 TaxID=1617448 RepID=UPI0005FC5B92|nr:fdxN element excision recombinase XisF [Geminocystis sp. NIES-3709]BAQ63956.1 probable DNA invertase [Geminocystis sp. NIES-3709]
MKVGYCRVSKREQAENSHALEQQEKRVREQGAEYIYCDIDSGSKDKRFNFLQLINDIENNIISEVICTRLDRLTRSLVKLKEFIKIVENNNVKLIALDDHVDTSSAVGRFQINMLGSLAEMEVDRLSERVSHGWNHLRDRKVAMNPPFGYCKVNDKFEFDMTPFLCTIHDQKEYSKYTIAQWIINTFFEVKGLRATVRKLNQYFGLFNSSQENGYRVRYQLRFSPSGLHNYLINPVLRGHLCYLKKSKQKDTIIIPNQHSPVITESQYQEIIQILSFNRERRGYGATAPVYPLSGLVFCAECRCACYSVTGNRGKTPGKNYYYQCKNWLVKGCSNKKMIRMDYLESSLINYLKQKYEELTALTLITKTQVIDPQITELQHQIFTLQSLPKNPAITEAIDKLELQIKELDFNQNNQDLSMKENQEYFKSIFSSVGFWDSLLPEDRRDIYRKLVSKIFVKDAEIVDIILKI